MKAPTTLNSILFSIQAYLLPLTTSTYLPQHQQPLSQAPGLSQNDCQTRCPPSTSPSHRILPAISQTQNTSGDWENILECWQVNSISTDLPGIDNAYRLDWETGFDAGYQYVFEGQSFMQAHSTPVESLIVVSGGVGKFPPTVFRHRLDDMIYTQKEMNCLNLID